MEKTPKKRIYVLIPAYNEEASLPLVLAALPKAGVRAVVVCNNGSTDRTAEVAENAGAVIVNAEHRGYGSACLAGIRYLQGLPASERPEIVVFLDGDYSDYPEDLPNVAGPVLNDGKDLVIGSRMLGNPEPGAMTLPQRFGNWLAPLLIRWLYGYRFTDLGPFRAIRWESLLALDMRDPNYGWTVEMQVKAAQQGLACAEVPVRYRKRAGGKSKVSGTLKGVLLAGWKIIALIFILYWNTANHNRNN
ncbi:MAG: glycosyltransferase family 2 protein [Saprospirales bacterium]|nr:glycosyltransferase family 2 protein [Saprospirales bacterium]MBK8923308.1 glycosyltransferase family 2 protein [Saprospirales bacterium]